MRAFDWSSTSLGPPEGWPQSLRSLVGLMLSARQAMFIAWGPELTFLYNDDYAPIFGAKHPEALGRPFAEVWSDIWPQISPLVQQTLGGAASWHEDLLIPMERHGFREEAWFSFSYTPVQDESGRVAGMFCAATETTDKVRLQRRLQEERERLRQMFEQAPGLMVMLRGQDHRFELANRAYGSFVGGRELLGRTVREAFPEVAGQGFLELLDEVYRSGEPHVGTGVPIKLARASDGQLEERFVDFIYQPIRGADGRVEGIFVEGFDVTPAKEAETALRASETRHRAIVEATPECVWIVARDGRLLEINPAGLAMAQVADPASVLGQQILTLIAPEHRKAWRSNHGKVCHGESASWEFDLIGLQGARRRMETHAVPLTLPDWGMVHLAVTRDVTERRRSEEQQQLLINELNHRVKNTLVTVQSIVHQSLRSMTDPLKAKADIEGRLLALSRAHDVLTQERWEAAGITAIVDQALAPHRGSDDMFDITGDELRLPPSRALAIAMALQELATNAVKYGALSSSAGKVRLSWRSVQSEGQLWLHLEWREVGGPPVRTPAAAGFGTRLIERRLAKDLDGTVTLDFAPAGVICRISTPVTDGGREQESLTSSARRGA